MKPELKLPKSKYSYEVAIPSAKIWKNPVFLIILFAVLILVFFKKEPPRREILDSDEYTKDGYSYRVTLEKKAEQKYWQGSSFLDGKSISTPFQLGKEIVIYEKAANAKNWQEKKRYDFEGVGPWCVAIGQMDEYEDIEVFFGAYRATRYFPEGPRPYFFTWDAKAQTLNRLWTGSYLDAPIFTKASFEDINGDGLQELKLEEVAWMGETEKHYLTYYTYLRKQFQPIKIHRQEITK